MGTANANKVERNKRQEKHQRSGIREMNNFNLKSMTVDDLLVLRDRILETLSSRIEAERRELETRLARLQRVDQHEPHRLARGGRVIGKRAIVVPKYRNPDKPTETWSGRGRQPRWLSAALKAGKKLRDFEIVEDQVKKRTSRGRHGSRGRRAA